MLTSSPASVEVNKLTCTVTTVDSRFNSVPAGTAELILRSATQIPRVPQAAKLTFATFDLSRRGTDATGNPTTITHPAGVPLYMVPPESYAESFPDEGSVMHLNLAPQVPANIDWSAVPDGVCQVYPQVQVTFNNLVFPPTANVRYAGRLTGRPYTRPTDACLLAVSSGLSWYAPLTFDCQLATAE